MLGPEAHRVADHPGAGARSPCRSPPTRCRRPPRSRPRGCRGRCRPSRRSRARAGSPGPSRRRRPPAPCGWRPCGRRGRCAARQRRSRRSRCSRRGRRSRARRARPAPAEHHGRALPELEGEAAVGMGGHHVRATRAAERRAAAGPSPRPSAAPSATAPSAPRAARAVRSSPGPRRRAPAGSRCPSLERRALGGRRGRLGRRGREGGGQRGRGDQGRRGASLPGGDDAPAQAVDASRTPGERRGPRSGARTVRMADGAGGQRGTASGWRGPWPTNVRLLPPGAARRGGVRGRGPGGHDHLHGAGARPHARPQANQAGLALADGPQPVGHRARPALAPAAAEVPQRPRQPHLSFTLRAVVLLRLRTRMR